MIRFNSSDLNAGQFQTFAANPQNSLYAECQRYVHGGQLSPSQIAAIQNGQGTALLKQLVESNPENLQELQAFSEAILGAPYNVIRKQIAEKQGVEFADVFLTPDAILQAGAINLRQKYIEGQNLIADMIFPPSQVNGADFFYTVINPREALVLHDDRVPENAMPNTTNLSGKKETATCLPYAMAMQLSNTERFRSIPFLGDLAAQARTALEQVIQARTLAHENRVLAMMQDTANYAGNTSDQTATKWNTANGKPFTLLTDFVTKAFVKPNYLVMNPNTLQVLLRNAEMCDTFNGANGPKIVDVALIEAHFNVKILVAGARQTSAAIGATTTATNSSYLMGNSVVALYAQPVNLRANIVPPVYGATAIVAGSQITTINQYAYGHIAPYVGGGVFGGALILSADMKTLIMPTKGEAYLWTNVV